VVPYTNFLFLPFANTSNSTCWSHPQDNASLVKSLASSYQVTNPLSIRQQVPTEARLCQLFFLAYHRIFQSRQPAKKAVDQYRESGGGFRYNLTRDMP